VQRVETGPGDGAAGRVEAAIALARAHPRLVKRIQWVLIALTAALCSWALIDQWSKASERLSNASPAWLALGFAVLAAYYLIFILGWIRLLAEWGIVVSYRVGLQAEMVSMLAKYLPGGVWTPAARTLALRRGANVTQTPTVLASILVEAALSAISGVIVFVISLAWVRDVNAPLPALVVFAVVLALALHPRILRPISERLLRPFGTETFEPLPFPLALFLLVFYCGTWLVGGAAVYCLLRSVGADVGLLTIPFLGGTSAVGAIVAVLVVFLPSGLGAREGVTYALLLAVTEPGPALGVTLLNRLAITIVEVALFGVGALSWRARRIKT
jgi:uncharacterized membrane protein YbhN (UPF0104 family)